MENKEKTCAVELPLIKHLDECSQFEGTSLIEQISEKLANDLAKKMEKIVKERLQFHGIELDFELESRRRFKSLIREILDDGDEETYWYNDGSEQGLRIVTFVRDKPDMTRTLEEPFVFTSGYSYY